MSEHSHLFAALDAQIAQHCRVRSTDPATSQAAAARANEFAAGHGARILAALQDHGPMTADEIAERTGLASVQVDRRIHELAKARVIRDTGQTRPSVSGRPMRVWEAVIPAQTMRRVA